MRNLNEKIENRKIDNKLLLNYGFKKINNEYIYQQNIGNDKFRVEVIINKDNMTSKIIDILNEEEYILVDLKTTLGEYASKIKDEYEFIINDIINKCSYIDSFKSKQTKKIITYIKEKYHNELEFLWPNSLDTAVFRCSDTNKWYGVLMIIEKKKLGFKDPTKVEILNLKYQKDKMDSLIDNKLFFRGYHMNKKSWLTIILDESVNINKIYELIDNSYSLVIKERK